MKVILKLILVILVLLSVLIWYGNYRFQKMSEAKVKEIYADLPSESGEVITSADLAALPPLMKKYLVDTGLVGQQHINKVQLKQQGRIRMSPEGRWLSFTAEQFYRLDKPAFVWNTTVRVLGIPVIRGVDVYQEGKGQMLIKVMPFFTVVNAQGEEVNSGAHSRYLNEIMWFPQMYLSPQIKFSSVDENLVRARFEDQGIVTVADIEINQDSRLVNFTCDRWYADDQADVTRKWSTPINEWGRLAGLELPLAGHAEWDLGDRTFKYIEIKLTDIKYGD